MHGWFCAWSFASWHPSTARLRVPPPTPANIIGASSPKPKQPTAKSAAAFSIAPSGQPSANMEKGDPVPQREREEETFFRLVASWSKAGVGTSLVVESSEQSGNTRVALDCGCTPIFPEAVKAPVVLISHGHVDHIGGIFGHARARAVKYGSASVPTYFVPAPLVPMIERARDAMAELDSASLPSPGGDGGGTKGRRMKGRDAMLPMKVVGVEPGDEIDVGEHVRTKGVRLILRAFAVDHANHPALGYVVCRQLSPKLRPEYRHLSGLKIRDLVKEGVNVRSDPEVRVELAYTGDTCADGLLASPPGAILLPGAPAAVTGDPDYDDDRAEEELARRKAQERRGSGVGEQSGDECDGMEVRRSHNGANTDIHKGGGKAEEAEDDRMRSRKKSDLHLRQAFRSPLILCELTYLDDKHGQRRRRTDDLAELRGHMHLDDVRRVLESHGWDLGASCGESDSPVSVKEACSDIISSTSSLPPPGGNPTGDKESATARPPLPRIVFFHLSARYSAAAALEVVSSTLPQCLHDRCDVTVSALMTGSTAGTSTSHGRKPHGYDEDVATDRCDEDDDLVGLVQSNGCVSVADFVAHRRR